MWWLKHGLVGWVVLSALWGVASIVFDVLIEALSGAEYTISWQVQGVSVANPVIPAAVGVVVGGLTVHFFKVRDWDWLDGRQPWLFYAAGFVAGAALVALTWTQRAAVKTILGKGGQ